MSYFYSEIHVHWEYLRRGFMHLFSNLLDHRILFFRMKHLDS